MPVMDWEYMLRDGTTTLNATETGDGVKLGPCPLGGMLLEIYRPTAGTTFSWKLQESDDDSSYSDVSGVSGTITTSGTSGVRAFWTKDYVRWVVTALTDSFGKVQAGLTLGGNPFS